MNHSVSTPTTEEAADANTCSQPATNKERRTDLRRCEKIIRRYEQSSLDAGAALMEVRDARLFELGGYDDFRGYVEVTCTFEYPRAQQLIRGAESLLILQAAGVEPLPTNEAQVRPLATHEDDIQVRAWKVALDVTGGSKLPSKRTVSDAVDTVTGRAARRAARQAAEHTRDWPRDAARAVARIEQPTRSAVAARVNARVETARATPEDERDVFERAAAAGATPELVEMV